MLGQAFVDDPLAIRLYPNAEKRSGSFARAAKCIMRLAVARGEVYASSANLEGVAIWFPPGYTALSTWDMLRSGMLFSVFFRGIRPLRLAMAYADHAAKLRKRHAGSPHWYLQLFGVHPAHRGAGYGSLLLRDMLKRLDRQHMPCYLDTENEVNVSMYEHFGFRVRESSPIPVCNCPCWFMAREPGRCKNAS